MTIDWWRSRLLKAGGEGKNTLDGHRKASVCCQRCAHSIKRCELQSDNIVRLHHFTVAERRSSRENTPSRAASLHLARVVCAPQSTGGPLLPCKAITVSGPCLDHTHTHAAASYGAAGGPAAAKPAARHRRGAARARRVHDDGEGGLLVLRSLKLSSSPRSMAGGTPGRGAAPHITRRRRRRRRRRQTTQTLPQTKQKRCLTS